MKNIFKLMALFAFPFCFSSCEDDEPVISDLRSYSRQSGGYMETCRMERRLLWMKVHTVM